MVEVVVWEGKENTGWYWWSGVDRGLTKAYLINGVDWIKWRWALGVGCG